MFGVVVIGIAARQHPSSSDGNFVAFGYLVISLGAAYLVIFESGSRTGMLGIVFPLLVFILMFALGSRGRGKIIAFLILAIGIGFGMQYAHLVYESHWVQRLGNLLALSSGEPLAIREQSVFTGIEMMRTVFVGWTDKPILGHGFDDFRSSGVGGHTRTTILWSFCTIRDW